ncbi:response regulator [Aquimarina mytili]|uniref:Response regulator n=1 Tax=Aquimarina mytili TaxID=874423 RepID=A0A936ZX69_9FLAO|nr:response regulator [Aquimarina mytili]MBL0682711.1 response regulator [Aquimarina mytili]
MEKLKSFLLIDDSKATNFFNKTIIEKVGCVEEVVVAENGRSAIEYIKSGLAPEIIFLDINMPVMNGWEFIAEYQKLDISYKKSIIILMLGAELSDADKNKAEEIIEIKEFQQKMLTKDTVCKIVSKYFSFSNCINA